MTISCRLWWLNCTLRADVEIIAIDAMAMPLEICGESPDCSRRNWQKAPFGEAICSVRQEYKLVAESSPDGDCLHYPKGLLMWRSGDGPGDG